MKISSNYCHRIIRRKHSLGRFFSHFGIFLILDRSSAYSFSMINFLLRMKSLILSDAVIFCSGLSYDNAGSISKFTFSYVLAWRLCSFSDRSCCNWTFLKFPFVNTEWPSFLVTILPASKDYYACSLNCVGFIYLFGLRLILKPDDASASSI